jgi:hypothetical protein
MSELNNKLEAKSFAPIKVFLLRYKTFFYEQVKLLIISFTSTASTFWRTKLNFHCKKHEEDDRNWQL